MPFTGLWIKIDWRRGLMLPTFYIIIRDMNSVQCWICNPSIFAYHCSKITVKKRSFRLSWPSLLGRVVYNLLDELWKINPKERRKTFVGIRLELERLKSHIKSCPETILDCRHGWTNKISHWIFRKGPRQSVNSYRLSNLRPLKITYISYFHHQNQIWLLPARQNMRIFDIENG